MLRQGRRIILLTIVSALLFGTCIFAGAQEEAFSVVVLPDTQREVSYHPEMWMAMAHWIADNASSRNIKAVIGVGDITDNHAASEFKTAQEGFRLIDAAGIPYVPIMGNHDYDDVAKRASATYDAYFGPDYFKDKPWYGAGFPAGSNRSFYIKFAAANHKYLVLALELYPNADTLAWAQGIAELNPDREIIVATHAYLGSNGARALDGSPHGPANYGLAADNSGQEMWDAFVKVNKNIIMTLNGHFVCPPVTRYLSDTGVNGNVVHQIFVDYQCQNSGDGYMMLLEFQPDMGKISVSFYSATLRAYDPNNPPYDLIYGIPAAAGIH